MMGEADDDAGREATTVEALPFVFLGASPCSHRNGALPPSTGLIFFYINFYLQQIPKHGMRC